MKPLKLLFLSLCFCSVLHAQVDSVYVGAPETKIDEKKKARSENWLRIKENLTFGGNFEGWFGNPSFLYVSPTVGYLLTEKLNVGIGFIYSYTSVDYGYYGKFSQSAYGGHSFIRYLITEGFFVQLQYDRLRQTDFFTIYPETKKIWVNYLFAGGGFRQPISDHAALTAALMYNLTPSRQSLYYPNRLIVQFGIVAGF